MTIRRKVILLSRKNLGWFAHCQILPAVPLLGAVARPKRLLADKAYDADSLRKWLKQRKVKAVVPSTASRRPPYPLDSKA